MLVPFITCFSRLDEIQLVTKMDFAKVRGRNVFTSRGEVAIDCCNYRSDELVIGFAETSLTQTAGVSGEPLLYVYRHGRWPM